MHLNIYSRLWTIMDNFKRTVGEQAKKRIEASHILGDQTVIKEMWRESIFGRSLLRRWEITARWEVLTFFRRAL